MLHGRVEDDGLAVGVARRLGRSEDGKVGGLGAAGRENDVTRIAAEEGGDLVARLLQQAPGPLGGRVAAGRIPEHEAAGIGVDLGHGGGHLGAQRRRGGVVEVGHSRHASLPARRTVCPHDERADASGSTMGFQAVRCRLCQLLTCTVIPALVPLGPLGYDATL